MRISISVEGLKDLFDPQMVNKAVKLAVKEAAAGAKTETSTAIRDYWNLKKTDLDKKLTVSGRAADLEAVLSISGPPVSLSYFGATQISGTRKLTRGKDGLIKDVRSKSGTGPVPMGVTVKIRNTSRTLLPKAWLTNTRNFAGSVKGGGELYSETSSARVLERFGGKIVGPKSISIASMFEQSRVSDRVTTKASEVLERRILHHLDRFIKGTSST